MEHVLPKMRTREDAKWLLDQHTEEEDLRFMIHSHEQMLLPTVTPGLQLKQAERVEPVKMKSTSLGRSMTQSITQR